MRKSLTTAFPACCPAPVRSGPFVGQQANRDIVCFVQADLARVPGP